MQKLTRRSVLQLMLQAGAVAALSPLYLASPANAETASAIDQDQLPAVQYQAFVPFLIARSGGKLTLSGYNGKQFEVSIPRATSEGQTLIVQNRESGEVRKITLHTLYDRQAKIGLKIYEELDSKVNFLQGSSRDRCKSVYETLEDGGYVESIEALGLLDYIVSTSNTLSEDIKQRYLIASQNSKLLGIEQAIKASLEVSDLTLQESRDLLGTFKTITAGNPISNLEDAVRLDAIVAGSALPTEIKDRYAIASATSLALTADLAIINQLEKVPSTKEVFLPVYQRIRDGKKLSDDERQIAQILDHQISTSSLPPIVIATYALTRGEEFSSTNQRQISKLVKEFIALNNDIDKPSREDVKNVQQVASQLVPGATNLLTTMGAEASTGAALSSLSGGAATNATLALLGGGSVAAGGLGMLGGLAVATGGAALLGAAGILLYASVSEFDREDYKNLGISVGAGTLTASAATLAAWTIAGAGTSLTGAAGIASTLAALGGVSVLTGGTALIASGATFLVWSLLKTNKKRDTNTLQEIEVRLHALGEPPKADSFAGVMLDSLPSEYSANPVYKGIDLELKKARNAMKSWLNLGESETIIAAIDTSMWNDLKEGICLTNQRIVWKGSFQDTEEITYIQLKEALTGKVSVLLESQQEYDGLQRLLSLLDVFLSEESEIEFSNFLVHFIQTPIFLAHEG
jgi:hypothetical protein